MTGSDWWACSGWCMVCGRWQVACGRWCMLAKIIMSVDIIVWVLSFMWPLQQCWDQPVQPIDLFSLKWYVACIVAASSNPQPRDNILCKDLIYHSSRAIYHPSNTNLLKNRQKPNTRWKIKNWSQTMTCPEIIWNGHPPTYVIGGIHHWPIAGHGSQLCCQWQLFWLPVNLSSKGDMQSCQIGIDMYVHMQRCLCVDIDIGDAFPWWCELPLDNQCERLLIPILMLGLTAGCMVVDIQLVEYISVSVSVLTLATLVRANMSASGCTVI